MPAKSGTIIVEEVIIIFIVIGFIVLSNQFVKIESGFLTVVELRCQQSSKLKNFIKNSVLLDLARHLRDKTISAIAKPKLFYS